MNKSRTRRSHNSSIDPKVSLFTFDFSKKAKLKKIIPPLEDEIIVSQRRNHKQPNKTDDEPKEKNTNKISVGDVQKDDYKKEKNKRKNSIAPLDEITVSQRRNHKKQKKADDEWEEADTIKNSTGDLLIDDYLEVKTQRKKIIAPHDEITVYQRKNHKQKKADDECYKAGSIKTGVGDYMEDKAQSKKINTHLEDEIAVSQRKKQKKADGKPKEKCINNNSIGNLQTDNYIEDKAQRKKSNAHLEDEIAVSQRKKQKKADGKPKEKCINNNSIGNLQTDDYKEDKAQHKKSIAHLEDEIAVSQKRNNKKKKKADDELEEKDTIKISYVGLIIHDPEDLSVGIRQCVKKVAPEQKSANTSKSTANKISPKKSKNKNTDLTSSVSESSHIRKVITSKNSSLPLPVGSVIVKEEPFSDIDNENECTENKLQVAISTRESNNLMAVTTANDPLVKYCIDINEADFNTLENSQVTGNIFEIRTSMTNNCVEYMEPNQITYRKAFPGLVGASFDRSNNTATGFLKISPRTIKPFEMTNDCRFIYWILSGEIIVRSTAVISQNEGLNYLYGKKLTSGSCLLVPSYTAYTIENRSHSEEVLLGYVQVKSNNDST